MRVSSLLSVLTIAIGCGPVRVPPPDRSEGSVECSPRPSSAPCPEKDEASVTAPPGYRLVSVDQGPTEKDDQCCYGITISPNNAEAPPAPE